jgi:O-methyltransferase
MLLNNDRACPLLPARQREAPCWPEGEDLAALLGRVRPYTMVPEPALAELARQASFVLAEGIPGQFVECGVWRGGAAFLIAELLRRAGARDRKVWLCDSFAGLPPPAEIDGAAALDYARSPDSPDYFENCAASLQDVQRSATALGLADYTEYVPGWFEETLPDWRARIGPIALLRVDCDWHASVRSCLEHLYDQVVEGGFVLFDDYYTFDGCAVAVHEFLGERRLPHRLESLYGRAGSYDYPQVAGFRKGDTTWYEARRTTERLHQAICDVAAAMPAGETLLLVDQGQWGVDGAFGGCRTLPFPEHDGEYWGPPADDAAAIAELERLRRAGARFIAFGWPAFWWLDYYAGLRDFLRSRFRCLLENDRLVLFDLREARG